MTQRNESYAIFQKIIPHQFRWNIDSHGITLLDNAKWQEETHELCTYSK